MSDKIGFAKKRGKRNKNDPLRGENAGQTFGVNSVVIGFFIEPYPIRLSTLERLPTLLIGLEDNGALSSNVLDANHVYNIGYTSLAISYLVDVVRWEQTRADLIAQQLFLNDIPTTFVGY